MRQVSMLRRQMPRDEFQGVTVTSVDNYQGRTTWRFANFNTQLYMHKYANRFENCVGFGLKPYLIQPAQSSRSSVAGRQCVSLRSFKRFWVFSSCHLNNRFYLKTQFLLAPTILILRGEISRTQFVGQPLNLIHSLGILDVQHYDTIDPLFSACRLLGIDHCSKVEQLVSNFIWL